MNAVPDTNVWVRWLRDRVPLRRSPQCEAWRVHLSSIVLHELWAGVRNRREADDLRRLYTLARRRHRLVTPPAPAWIRSGQVLSELAHTRRFGPARLRSIRNDVLLAVSASFADATVLTDNVADFEVIAAITPVRYERVEPA